MVAGQPKMDALAAEAWAMYNTRLKAKLEPRENGKFLVLNLDTGEYEVDADDLTATNRAIARFGKARLITLRVGDFAAYDLGGSGLPGV